MKLFRSPPLQSFFENLSNFEGWTSQMSYKNIRKKLIGIDIVVFCSLFSLGRISSSSWPPCQLPYAPDLCHISSFFQMHNQIIIPVMYLHRFVIWSFF